VAEEFIMASSIVFSGLASGIDSEAIVNSLVQSARVPMGRLQAQKGEFSAQAKKLSDIKSKLTALQSAAKGLDTRTEALGNKVSSSDEKALKAVATGGASMGSFKVEVKSVAQAERTYSNNFASSSVAGVAGAGELKIQVGSTDEVSIDIEATDTLSMIASKINASGAEVSAGVFHDGTEYRLQVTARKSGLANALTFTEGTGLALGLNDEDNERQKASDAVIVIDELEVHSSTNAVAGAVPGVTLNVVDKGTSVIQVDRDSDTLKTKINSFITSYNDVMKTLNAEFSYVGVAKGRESLMGDGTLHSLQAALRGALSKVTDNGASSLTTFGSIGISAQRDGTLMLDDAKYGKAVSSDYEGVASALAGRSDLNGLMTMITTAVEPYAATDGTLRTKIDNLGSRNRRIDQQMASMQTRMDKYEESLRRQYAILEQTISGLQSQGNSLNSILSSM
jgi:flagellar hook-associated protein 2